MSDEITKKELQQKDSEQDREISAISTDISWIKDSLEDVRAKVTNHIPHRINGLEENVRNDIDNLEKRINSLVRKIVISFVVGILSIVVTQIILQIFS